MPLPRTPRRLIEDPANEPDLYAITKLHPVPLTGPEEDKPEAPPIAVASIPPQRPTPDELLAAALTGANASSLSSALALLRSSQHRPLASSIPNVAAAAAASSSYPTQQQHAAALAASARMDPNSLTAYLSINNPLATAMSTATYPASSTVNNMFSSNAINTTDATANHLAARQRLWLASQATNNIAADGAAAAASSPAFLSGVALQQHLNLDANTFFSNRQQHQQYHHHRLGLESSIMNAALYAAASAAAAATSESKVNSNGPPGGSSSDES